MHSLPPTSPYVPMLPYSAILDKWISKFVLHSLYYFSHNHAISMNTTGRLKDKVLWMYIRSLKSYRTALVLSYLSVVLINYTIIMIIQIQMMTRFQVLELKTISYLELLWSYNIHFKLGNDYAFISYSNNLYLNDHIWVWISCHKAIFCESCLWMADLS